MMMGSIMSMTHLLLLLSLTLRASTAFPTVRHPSFSPPLRAVVSDVTESAAVRLAHILLASPELAQQTLDKLISSEWDFEQTASTLSLCQETRHQKGAIGWVNLQTNNNNHGNQHLEAIFPTEARDQLHANIKEGTVAMVTSGRGVHLVKVWDVMEHYPILPKHAPTIPNGGTKLARLFMGEQVQLKYSIETMGCQMNSADSERMEGQLEHLGMIPNNNITPSTTNNNQSTTNNRKKRKQTSRSDVIVLNTCSIRDHAEQKLYSYLGPHAKRKRAGEDITIIVAGCVAQQEGQALLRRIPEIDLVMGPQYANQLSDLLEDVANGNQVVATERTHIMEDSTKPRRKSSVCAWVNVIYGCNEKCTYCVVPTTRGQEQSRPQQSILEEVQDLVHRGYKEVTLLGQNIDAYGRDMTPKRKFSDLLRQVGNIPGLERLRFVTSHPRYMSLGVVDAVAETPSACEYFHVPFQSGSNEILKAMGRGHTREKFLGIIHRIRQRLPDAGISADCIVGFPGETEQDFLQTLSLMEEVKFDNVNTAAYSPRPNTPAATWPNQLSEEVKQDRLRRINELNLQHATERRARMMDRVVEVLVEERNVKVPTQVMGRTGHGYIVYCDGDIDTLRGKLVKVRITQCQRYYLTGKIVEE